VRRPATGWKLQFLDRDGWLGGAAEEGLLDIRGIAFDPNQRAESDYGQAHAHLNRRNQEQKQEDRNH
jgi:hypothetical protein